MFDPITFEADLVAAHARAKARQEILARQEQSAEQAFWKGQKFSVPTAERLHKHAARFGIEGAKEISTIYKINLKLRQPDPKAPKRQRRSSGELRRQVLSLRERGLVVGAIANELNVSDRRVKAILVEQAA